MLVNVTQYIEQLIYSMGIFAPILACILITVESVVPVLPLCTFITINFISFGSFLGFIISWIFTCIGCFLSYFLIRKGFRNWYKKRISAASLLDKSINYVNKLSFPLFTSLLAMPFTPAFMINIAAGLVGMEFKKFFGAILIGKIFMVYFWGYTGVGLVESFENPLILVRILTLTLIAYLISSILKFFINENK